MATAIEPWGIDLGRPKLQHVLDVPEKVFFEVRYEPGPPDRVLPLDAATGQWGLRRGLSVSVVHPDPTRRATSSCVTRSISEVTSDRRSIHCRTWASDESAR